MSFQSPAVVFKTENRPTPVSARVGRFFHVFLLQGPFSAHALEEKQAYFTPIQPEMTMRWTSEVPS